MLFIEAVEASLVAPQFEGGDGFIRDTSDSTPGMYYRIPQDRVNIINSPYGIGMKLSVRNLRSNSWIVLSKNPTGGKNKPPPKKVTQPWWPGHDRDTQDY